MPPYGTSWRSVCGIFRPAAADAGAHERAGARNPPGAYDMDGAAGSGARGAAREPAGNPLAATAGSPGTSGGVTTAPGSRGSARPRATGARGPPGAT